MSEARYRSLRAGVAHTEGLLALFESAGSGCFCNYWHFEGDKNAWLERCFVKPEENRAALVARLAAPELCGVVALGQNGESDGQGQGTVCGWMKVTRALALPRLYQQRVYKNLPCFGEQPREQVYTIACALVAEAERGHGAARSLLSAAIAAVREAGGVAIEAFPRATPEGERLRADEVWMGPEALFTDAGFTPVSDFRPYPVLRLHLP